MSKRNKHETAATLELGPAQAMIAGDQAVFNEWLATHKDSRAQLRKMLFDILMVAKLYHYNEGRLEGRIKDQAQERQRLLDASRQMEDAYNREVNENNHLREQVEVLTAIIDHQADAQETQNRLSAALIRAAQLGIVFVSKE